MSNYSKDNYYVTYENIYDYKNYNKVLLVLFILLFLILIFVLLLKFN